MLNDLRYRLRSLFRRHVMEAELDQELRFHFEPAPLGPRNPYTLLVGTVRLGPFTAGLGP
jgi:hypothetical protein